MHTFRLIIVFLFSIPLFSGCSWWEDEVPEDVIGDAPIPVEVMQTDTQRVERSRTVTGNLEAWRKRNIAANQAGRIVEIYVREGDEVSAGRKLVQMEDAQLRQARIQLEQIERRYKRMDTLYREGAISRQDFESAETEYYNQLTNYEVLEDNTQLTAPFDGIITAKYMEDGDLYTASPMQGSAPAIVTLQKLDKLKLEVSLSERFFPEVRKGMLAEVKSDVYPDRTFDAEISNIFPVINPATRTFTIELRIENEDQTLRPGMFARVQLRLGDREGLMVPKSALRNQPGSQNKYVYVVKDGLAERRIIETGIDGDEWVEVLSGIEAGETLVTTGQGRLQEGFRVDIVREQ